jgi:predicted dehydrogenase
MGAFIDNEVAGSPSIVLPYSHAAGYGVCERTELVACSDLRPDVMEQVGKRYGIPRDRQYVDYGEMLERERPDIVSVATQPEQRAEVVIYAAEHGARAIYAEKAMAASMAEADAIVQALERNGVFFNLGANRRWDPGYDTMKEVIDSGRMGTLKTLIAYDTGALFNGASHAFDLLLRLNGDRPVAWVQAELAEGDWTIERGVLTEDPSGHGIIQFEDGVTAYALLSSRHGEYEAVCERGTMTSLSNGAQWALREHGAKGHGGRPIMVTGAFPAFRRASSTLGLIEDLVHSLDTGEPSRCGARVARASTELIFAFIESHLRGGARVELPLTDSKIRLQRIREPRQPRYAP